jgi:hypothetical protein
MRVAAALLLGLLLAGVVQARDDDRESYLRDIVIGPGESVDDAVCVFCSVVVRGTVRSDVVVIGGGVEVEGVIEDDVVILGGGLRLAPGARIGENVIAYGGPVERGEGSRIEGTVVVKPYFHLPGQRQVFLEGLLALGGLNLLLVLLLSMLLRRRVSRLADTLMQRPGRVLVTGVLAMAVLAVVLYFADEGTGWLETAGWVASGLLLILFLPGYVGLTIALGRLVVRRGGPLGGLIPGVLATTLLLIAPIVGFGMLLLLVTLAVGITGISGLGALSAWLHQKTGTTGTTDKHG